MEPAVSSSDKGLVCETCGDKGYTNAFVYCVKCLDVAIHRYCLYVMPKAFNERVIWYCEDCHVKAKKKQKKESGISSLIAESKEVNFQKNSTEHANHIPKKNCTNANNIEACLVAKRKENKIQNGLISQPQEDYTTINLQNKEAEEQIDESQPSHPSCEHKKLISDSLSSYIIKESDKATTDVSQSVNFENNLQGNYYRHAQPVIDPIWRGSFTVSGTDYDPFEGFVAHLSNKALYKAFEEASVLPSLLHLEMHPKSVMWPKSFQECEPSDDNIALYFFAGDPINVKAFDRLVLDMMDKELAMRTTTKNAELLIFTSLVLPLLFRRFNGKYYLWGVFRGKRNDSASVATHDITVSSNSDRYAFTKDSPSEVVGIKSLGAHSPQSPFSNNGIDVLETFVECIDKATGHTVLCEGSECIHAVLEEGSIKVNAISLHGCDVVNTKRLETCSEQLDCIHT